MVSDVLIVIDLQNGVNSEDFPLARLNEVLSGVNERIAVYRDAGKPVIFVQHVDAELVIDNEDWRVMPELDARTDDLYVNKTHANSFYKTGRRRNIVWIAPFDLHTVLVLIVR
ncbi:isochorismatase family protein [Listeria booriae]|uniref:isochorismatase family protein n=1 Tax=Listeria booriae TaxID=1552123 RepID=UPI0035D98BF7